jgi:NAD-dependent deacetylase
MDEATQKVKEILKRASHIAMLTGAGVSAESGVPTFRGAGGLWRNYRAEELATPQAFARDPKLVWEFYNYRREMMSKVSPNPAHHAIAAIEQAAAQFTLITQNIDGLHAAAGSKNIIEIHGNIWRLRCGKCGRGGEDRRVPVPYPPECTECSGMLRPDVVWFGESLDPNDIQNALEAANTCDVMLVVGTSAIVHPAASFAMYPKQRGVPLIEINLEATPLSPMADYTIYGPAGEVMPGLI